MSTQEFSEAVDARRATISATGRLTDRAADLISGTVEALRRSGHHRITVHLEAVDLADAAALSRLRSVANRLRADRDELVVLTEEGKMW